MNEQKVLLILMILAVAVTLGLYIFKAVKQVKYKGDERWSMIQLKVNNAANRINWVLLVALFVVQVSVDTAAIVTVSRVVTLGLLYIGARNLVELCATFVYDRRY